MEQQFSRMINENLNEFERTLMDIKAGKNIMGKIEPIEGQENQPPPTADEQVMIKC